MIDAKIPRFLKQNWIWRLAHNLFTSIYLQCGTLLSMHLSIYLFIYLSIYSSCQWGLEYADWFLCRWLRSPNQIGVSWIGYCVWWWGSSSGDLVCVEYSFIAITLRFTLIRSNNTFLSSIYGSNRSVLNSFVFVRTMSKITTQKTRIWRCNERDFHTSRLIIILNGLIYC